MDSDDKNINLKISAKEERVCHYRKLFIKESGDIYPCCRAVPTTLIGNIKDENIYKTIENKNIICECSSFKSRKQTPNDKVDLNYLNLELSLLCQAHCLVCYANSPYWKGEYNLYPELEKIIDQYIPKIVIVQGGEILVQEKSLEWIAKIKQKYPTISFQLVTNLNVNLDMIDIIEKLFDTITVSFMGFQPETYKAVAGLNIDKTMQILDKLFENNKVKIRLKFVETPSSLHEAPMFLEWALSKNPEKIYMHDSDVNSRTNLEKNSHFYWEVLYKKTGDQIRKILLNNKDKFNSKEKYIAFFQRNATYYDINQNFLEENKMGKSIIVT